MIDARCNPWRRGISLRNQRETFHIKRRRMSKQNSWIIHGEAPPNQMKYFNNVNEMRKFMDQNAERAAVLQDADEKLSYKEAHENIKIPRWSRKA